MHRRALIIIATGMAAGWTPPAFAEDALVVYGPQPADQPGEPPAGAGDISAAAPMPAADAAPAEAERRREPLFPIWAHQARERGYRIQRAFGMSGMTIHNRQNMDSDNLAVAIAKGTEVPDGDLLEVPFVTTDKLESHTSNTEFKADLWVFPFLNLFAGIGKVKGHVDVGVDIDLDAFVPFPFCRPAKPCGTMKLPFEAKVDSTAITLGSILAYGSNDWFVAASIARTFSIASGDRSDLTTTDISLRLGPRLHFNESVILTPYVGANYFDFDARVSGVVQSGPAFEDGDPVTLRYRVDLSTHQPWAIINGFNLELSSHFALQAEYNWGEGSDRFILSATFRP
ncbi:hypothetical protein SAMN06295912_102122 [Sphingomonas laterariae]|uniref:MetA-pathway of phenol degradation n=1 Tax=Edaphosphingomonas laterariae TaxID=861865 RepID=A0A239CDF3_9SPHN|nr:autotransporter outer membrane beta-barrel domain-containing protein [Sphingomonas laterariae]SNS17698.1 hypothetical protein SAMN06295912_102122 [Sphingomonas laterariae]